MRIFLPILIGMLIGNVLYAIIFNSSHESIDKEKRKILFDLNMVYSICKPKDENPFSKQECHDVIISDTIGYYVQYYEVGKKDGPHYSRSCEEFEELINNCK